MLFVELSTGGTKKGIWMYRIVLIDILCGGHYGVRCISSALKDAGFDVKCIYASNLIQDTNRLPPKQAEAMYDMIKELKPDVIGLTAISAFSHYFISEMATKIRTFSDAPIILGGPHPSVSPKFILENADIDFICVGEGEATSVEMCRALESGNDPSDIPGVMSKKTLTYIRRDPPADLDSLPFQDMSNQGVYDIDKDGKVVEKDRLLEYTTYFTRASRGCPFRCSYCSNDALRSLYSRGVYCRRRSVNNVIDEIKKVVELNPGCEKIWFMDDTFPYVKSWVAEFAEKYAKEINLPFLIWLHPQVVKEENIALLKSAGLVAAVTGVESACEKTRKEVFLRTEKDESILETDRVLTKYGVEKTYDFLFDHPWESDNELPATLELLIKMHRPFNLNLHSLAIMPQTGLAKRAEKEGISTEEEIINKMAVDPLAASRTFQWVKGIPEQVDPKRRYRMMLIMMMEKKSIPLELIKFLAKEKCAGNIVIVRATLFTYKAYKTYGRVSRRIKKAFAG